MARLIEVLPESRSINQLYQELGSQGEVTVDNVRVGEFYNHCEAIGEEMTDLRQYCNKASQTTVIYHV